MAENTKIEWADHIDPQATGRVLGSYKSAARKIGCSVEHWLARRLAGEKWCFACRQWKHRTNFTRDASRKGGLTSQCRPCMSVATKASIYGVRRADISALQERHKGKCAVCKRERRVVVDHDHATGVLRGMLCDRCNQGLGFFADDPSLLRSAANYLENGHG